MDEDGGRGEEVAALRTGVVGWMFTFAAAAYNIVRIRNLATVVE